MISFQSCPKLKSLKKLNNPISLSKPLSLILLILLPITGWFAGWHYRELAAVSQEYNELISSQQTQDTVNIQNTKKSILDYGLKSECTLRIDFDGGGHTSLDLQPGLHCTEEHLPVNISNFGEYLAYTEKTGGVDSVVNIYNLERDNVTTLFVYGTSEIIDLIFLPNDILAVLNGYPKIPEEHWLTVYNIPDLYDNYADNTENYEGGRNYFKFDRTSPDSLSKSLELPDVAAPTRLRISAEGLIVDTAETDGVVIFGPEDYNFQTVNGSSTQE